jgi:hypothetical protein
MTSKLEKETQEWLDIFDCKKPLTVYNNSKHVVEFYNNRKVLLKFDGEEYDVSKKLIDSYDEFIDSVESLIKEVKGRKSN